MKISVYRHILPCGSIADKLRTNINALGVLRDIPTFKRELLSECLSAYPMRKRPPDFITYLSKLVNKVIVSYAIPDGFVIMRTTLEGMTITNGLLKIETSVGRMLIDLKNPRKIIQWGAMHAGKMCLITSQEELLEIFQQLPIKKAKLDAAKAKRKLTIANKKKGTQS